MAPRQPLNDEQRRLLRITGRMPLASVNNLASVMETTEDQVRGMLGRLRGGGWVASVMRGMTERRQHRFFLTGQAVDLLYSTDHQHPSPREEARAEGLAAFHPKGELPQDYQERFALDHDHPTHQEEPGDFPFAAATESDDAGSSGAGHEHPTRPGPPPPGAWRCPCAAWPCWSRSTAWPPTCSRAAGSNGPQAVPLLPEKSG